MPSPTISIAGRAIGPEHPTYVIAEMSGNHNGKFDHAIDIMVSAKKAGADAVKLQTYTADTITIDSDRPEFMLHDGLWKGRRLYELYDWAKTPWEWHEALFAKGRELGITVFSTPFDSTAVEFLESLGTPAYKIASFEANDLPLIERVAATGKPVIISTGTLAEKEIVEAIEAAKRAGCKELSLLHCISAYPTKPEEVNLRTIPDMAAKFSAIIGFSDHTLGTAVSIAAVSLGASIIEKHFTLSRADGGPDAAFSIEPEEMQTLCDSVLTAWKATGKPTYGPAPSEKNSHAARRSIYSVKPIKLGEILTKDNIRSIRPGLGLPPKVLPEIFGRKASQDIPAGVPLTWDMIG